MISRMFKNCKSQIVYNYTLSRKKDGSMLGIHYSIYACK